MDKILAFLKEAKWFSISIAIFMVIWLGPKLLDSIEEYRIEAEQEARRAVSTSTSEALTPKKNKIILEESMGFICKASDEEWEIKFILEKHDGKFVGSTTFYNEKITGSVDYKIRTWTSGENSANAKNRQFNSLPETLRFNIAGSYKYHRLSGNYLILDRTNLSFLIQKETYGRFDYRIQGQCAEVNYKDLLKEKDDHNLETKNNNVL